MRPLKRTSDFFVGWLIVLAAIVTFFRYFRTITKQTFCEAIEIADGFRPSSVQGLKSQNDAFWERLQIGLDLISGRYSDHPTAAVRKYSPLRRAAYLPVFVASILVGLYLAYGFFIGWVLQILSFACHWAGVILLAVLGAFLLVVTHLPEIVVFVIVFVFNNLWLLVWLLIAFWLIRISFGWRR